MIAWDFVFVAPCRTHGDNLRFYSKWRPHNSTGRHVSFIMWFMARLWLVVAIIALHQSRTPLRQSANACDKIKLVWSVRFLLDAMKIAWNAAAYGAITCDFNCMWLKSHMVAQVCGGLKWHLTYFKAGEPFAVPAIFFIYICWWESRLSIFSPPAPAPRFPPPSLPFPFSISLSLASPWSDCTLKVETHRTRFGKAARFFSFHSQISLLLQLIF